MRGATRSTPLRAAAWAALAVGVASGVARGDEPGAAPTAPAAGAPKASPPAALQVVTVAAMGDSLTDARSHGGRFLELLRERCPRSRFDNFGKGGQMVNQMRHRFAEDLFGPDRPRYTHVIVFGGVNDLYSDLTAGRTPAKIESDLSRMYDEARHRGARVVAITVAPWGGFRRYFNESRAAATVELNGWIKAQQGGAVDAVIDAYGLLSCGDPQWLCPGYAAPLSDGLHFGPEGHRRLADALYAQVFAGCA